MKNISYTMRGITAVVAILLFICMALTTLTLGNATWINSNLKISESEIIGGQDGDFAIYWENKYGYSSSALTDVYKDAAEANIEIARESVTLLKNDNNALPLGSSEKITLFGSGSNGNISHSNSSGDVPVTRYTLLSAMTEDFGDNVYSQVVTEANVAATGFNDVALVTFSRDGGEGSDANVYNNGRRYLALTESEESMMTTLKNLKTAGTIKKIVVIIGNDFDMELGFLDTFNVDACILAGHYGDYGCKGVSEVLKGTVNPSGRTVDTYAANSISSPAVVATSLDNKGTYKWSNYDAMGEYDKINNTKNVGYYTIYSEGIYVGYKYYETRYEDLVMGNGNADANVGVFESANNTWNYDSEVCYTFGYGLSYTNFSQKIENVKKSNGDYVVTVSVTNNGTVAGKDVIEVYAQTPYGQYEIEKKVEKASVNLVGYAKTDKLEPGETKKYEVNVRGYFLASYDTNGYGTYILSAGEYFLALGNGAHDALNNILAKKGYTTQDGMTANGNGSLVYTWNQNAIDATTYSTSQQTGKTIGNLFADADLNYYDGYEYVYLTRNDWEGTWPQITQLSATTQMMETLTNYYYETPEDAPTVESFTQGADNGIKLSDLIYVDYDDEKWDLFLDQLTIEQLCNTFTDSKSKNIISDLDVPGTAKGDDDTNAAGGAITFVSHPSTARTWNVEMDELRGNYQGLICTLKGTEEIWYGAGNLHRTPFGGRARQYWSEDANLDYWNGYYECKAAQAVGAITCVKHMCCNDQESYRTGLSVFIQEQALREIYLRAFEGSFDGGALSVMTTTGRVGTMLGKNYSAMLTDVLRGEWGFKGHVTSDGYVNTGYYNNTLEELVAGMDYSCCDSAGANAGRILAAIKDGDGYILQCMRTAAKRNFYVMTQTAAMNGLGNSALIVAIVPAWEMAVTVIDLVVAGAFVLCLAGSITLQCLSIKKNETSREV